jgi:hypothetical protein
MTKKKAHGAHSATTASSDGAVSSANSASLRKRNAVGDTGEDNEVEERARKVLELKRFKDELRERRGSTKLFKRPFSTLAVFLVSQRQTLRSRRLSTRRETAHTHLRLC